MKKKKKSSGKKTGFFSGIRKAAKETITDVLSGSNSNFSAFEEMEEYMIEVENDNKKGFDDDDEDEEEKVIPLPVPKPRIRVRKRTVFNFRRRINSPSSSDKKDIFEDWIIKHYKLILYSLRSQEIRKKDEKWLEKLVSTEESSVKEKNDDEYFNQCISNPEHPIRMILNTFSEYFSENIDRLCLSDDTYVNMEGILRSYQNIGNTFSNIFFEEFKKQKPRLQKHHLSISRMKDSINEFIQTKNSPSILKLFKHHMNLELEDKLDVLRHVWHLERIPFDNLQISEIKIKKLMEDVSQRMRNSEIFSNPLKFINLLDFLYTELLQSIIEINMNFGDEVEIYDTDFTYLLSFVLLHLDVFKISSYFEYHKRFFFDVVCENEMFNYCQSCIRWMGEQIDLKITKNKKIISKLKDFSSLLKFEEEEEEQEEEQEEDFLPRNDEIIFQQQEEEEEEEEFKGLSNEELIRKIRIEKKRNQIIQIEKTRYRKAWREIKKENENLRIQIKEKEIEKEKMKEEYEKKVQMIRLKVKKKLELVQSNLVEITARERNNNNNI